MRSRLVFGLLLLLLNLCGCGGQKIEPEKKRPLDAAEKQEAKALIDELRRQVQNYREVLNILKAVSDRRSMEQALQNIEKQNKKFESAAQKFSHLMGATSEEVLYHVQEDPAYAELRELQGAMVLEMVRIEKLTDGPEFTKAWKKLTEPKTP